MFPKNFWTYLKEIYRLSDLQSALQEVIMKSAIRILSCIFILSSIWALPSALCSYFPWSFSFETGATHPTENFNRIVDDDRVLGINFEYLSFPYLGVRVAFDSQKFNMPYYAAKKFEINNLAVSAIVAYSFPKWFRIFAFAGPNYYSTRNQTLAGYTSDNKDIGWNGGGGFEFFPIPQWGIRFQSNYSSAELNNDETRLSWVNSTVGLTFRF
jgi:opacity protein-like surface antigen